jgi:hypothetical protein
MFLVQDVRRPARGAGPKPMTVGPAAALAERLVAQDTDAPQQMNRPLHFRNIAMELHTNTLAAAGVEIREI